ncbi:hydroxyisourate hydrolase [Angustibacter sp. McL0619]|uniref:hydroxyisourate hydrolase n=1 Tax=Angustibacter sp. McL0619 TaxID=3415676 RepID=UPI003CFB3F78
MTSISTHVLDTALGRPARGVPVRLETQDGTVLAEAVTDDDGRVGQLGGDDLAPGRVRLVFDTAAYLATTGEPAFFPEVVVTIDVFDGDGRLHVPLLLSPFAYSTYRGS